LDFKANFGSIVAKNFLTNYHFGRLFMQKVLLFFSLIFVLCFVSCYQPMAHQRWESEAPWPRQPLVINDSSRVLTQKFISQIRAYLGTPYRYGGSSTDGMDCSGLVRTVFWESFGLELPHNSYQLYQTSQRIKKKDLCLGDLVFFSYRGTIDHVGIYLVKNYFVHASASSGVKISNLNESYYRSRFRTAGRIVKLLH